MSTTTERNARLQALAAASQSWADQKLKTLNANVATAKAILKGRTGSDRLPAKTVAAASTVVVDEIDAFLNT